MLPKFQVETFNKNPEYELSIKWTEQESKHFSSKTKRKIKKSQNVARANGWYSTRFLSESLNTRSNTRVQC